MFVHKRENCQHTSYFDGATFSQVILSRTIENHSNIRSVATKMAIQLNCKLGGKAWCLPMSLSNTIVIGYDTYHNAGSRNRTVGAFVASMNQTFTRWYSRVSFPSTHEQLGIMLTLHLRDCLSKYAQANLGAFPERIIIFRNGVSDGQIPQVSIVTILCTNDIPSSHVICCVMMQMKLN